MAKGQFSTETEPVDETETTATATMPKTRTRKPAAKPAKAVSARRLTAKTKYQTVQNIVKEEKAVSEATTVAELLDVLKERVFEEAVG